MLQEAAVGRVDVVQHRSLAPLELRRALRYVGQGDAAAGLAPQMHCEGSNLPLYVRLVHAQGSNLPLVLRSAAGSVHLLGQDAVVRQHDLLNNNNNNNKNEEEEETVVVRLGCEEIQ